MLRSRYFWVLTIAFALSTLSIFAVRIHFLPLLISVGIHPSTAALASSAIGIMQVAGRMIFAPIERRYSSKTMAIGVFALLTVAMAVLLLGKTPLLIVAFVALFGMAIGTHTLARPLIIADSYGSAFYGRVSSSMVVLLTLASTAAPVAAGLIFDRYASYDPLLLLVTALCALAVVALLLLPRGAEGRA